MDSREVEEQTHSTPPERTFRWMPVIVVSLCMGSSYFMVTSVYPYAGFMVMRFAGVSADRAGFQAGWIGGSLAFGRVLTTFFWGWAVDYFGRKPVLLWSMTIIAASMITLGMAESLHWAITIRLLQGLLTGVMCVSRVLAAELAGEEHVVTAMAMLAAGSYLGMSAGPAIGGLCAEPARHYPSVFSSTGLFGRYPFLLPNLVGAAVASLAIPLVIFLVPETKKPARGALCRRGRYTRAGKGELEEENEGAVHLPGVRVKYEALPDPAEGVTKVVDPKPVTKGGETHDRGDGGGRDPESPALSCVPEEEEYGIQGANAAVSRGERCPVPPLDMESAATEGGGNTGDAGIFSKGGLESLPNIHMVFIMGFLFSMVLFGLEELFPLWALSSRGAGGLQWDTPQIGAVVAFGGASVAFYQVFVYPWLAEKMGIVTTQHFAGFLGCVLFVAMPNITYLGHNEGFLTVASAVLIALLTSSIVTTEVGLSLVTTNPVPPRLRGKMNGLYLTCYYAGSVSPWLCANVFAWSISSGRAIPLIDHRFTFNSAAVITLIVTLLGLKVFTFETMTLVADDAPSTPLSLRGLGISTPRSVRTSRRHFSSPAVSGGRRGDLV